MLFCLSYRDSFHIGCEPSINGINVMKYSIICACQSHCCNTIVCRFFQVFGCLPSDEVKSFAELPSYNVSLNEDRISAMMILCLDHSVIKQFCETK